MHKSHGGPVVAVGVVVASDSRGMNDTKPLDIAALRKQAGLTRAQVCIAARCSLTALGNLEAGLIPQRSDVLPRVLAVLQDATQHGEG